MPPNVASRKIRPALVAHGAAMSLDAMAALPPLELRCFGPPTALVDGREPPTEVLWRKHLALLIYLALSPGRTRTREHLRGLLWPEKDEDYARRSLNEAVRRLRRVLGAARLRTHADSLELGDVALTVDALETHANNPAPQGEFLEGFTLDGCHVFEEWASQERERARHQVLSRNLAAGERHLAATRFRDAAACGRQALALHPLSEPAIRLVMRALALSGDRASALGAYHDYASRLRETIGEKPGRELVALAERIRNGWIPAPVRRTETEPPLVGRHAIHALAFEVVTTGTINGARTILIAGAPGMGRTRLLMECAARLGLEGAVVASAWPLATDTDERWSTLRSLLRGGLAQAPGLAGAAPKALGVLSALAPNLGLKGTPVEPRDTAEVAMALRDTLGAIAHEQPVGIAIDDAQHADEATLAALLGAMELLRNDRVILVLSIPDGSSNPASALLQLRKEIGQRLAGVTVHLKPLTDEDISALTRQMASWCEDESALARLARRISHESGGVPFFAVTLLLGVTHPNGLRDDLLTWPPTVDSTQRVTLPDRIGAAITARVVELDEEARNVLAAATIGGSAFDLELIAALTDLPRGKVEDALGRAEIRRLVAFDGDRYVFPAAVIADVIYRQALTPGTRQTLRRRAVEALAARRDLDSRVLRTELLARVEPGARTFDEAVRLAAEARDSGAHRASGRALEAATRAAGKQPTPEQRQTIEELRTRLSPSE